MAASFALLAGLMLSALVPCSGNAQSSQVTTAFVQVMHDGGLSSEQKAKPHIMLTLFDDLGYHDFIDSKDIGDAWTYLGSLAKQECVNLERFYTMSLCSPSRAALMTGRMPIHLGLQHNVIESADALGMPLDEVTLATKLQSAGYHTIGVGKWHLGMYTRRHLPTRRGFDHWYGFLTGGESYYQHSTMVNGKQYVDLLDNEETDWYHAGIYSTYLFTDKAVEFIEEHANTHADKPLFVYHSIPNPHMPLEVPESYKRFGPCEGIFNENRQTFCGMAKAADESVEKVYESFKKQLKGETALLVMGDNGGQTSQGGNNCYAMGEADCLRGRKGLLWEGGIRNHALLCSPSESLVPKKLRGTTFSKGFVSLMDVHATVTALAGASESMGHRIDGESIWTKVMANDVLPRNELLVNIEPCKQLTDMFHCEGWSAALIYDGCFEHAGCGTWKAIYGESSDGWYPIVGTSPMPTLKGGMDGTDANATFVVLAGANATFIAAVEGTMEGSANRTRLYNIAVDASEEFDRIEDFPEVADFLLSRIVRYSQGMVEACNVIFGSCAGTTASPIHDQTGAWIPWADELAEDYIVVGSDGITEKCEG